MTSLRTCLLVFLLVAPVAAQVRFPQPKRQPAPSQTENEQAGVEETAAPTAEKPANEGESEHDVRPTEGLWPSSKLMKSLLSRWANEAATRYDLDETQRGQFRDRLVDRWTEFLDDNRPILQPLANEFIEMRMGIEPPDAETVQEWSSRALPAFEKVKTQMRHSQDEFRETLSPLQRAKFEVDALATGAGLLMAESKLREWQRGEFDPEDVWEPLPSMRRDRDRDEAEEPAASSRKSSARKSKKAKEPQDQISAELTAWEEYVADFIARHDLAEGQRTSALSCLREVSERATSHRDRHRVEIEELEKRIAAPENSPQELDSIKNKLVELYGPVDDMFSELKSRLDAIPTAEQRARAAEQPEQK